MVDAWVSDWVGIPHIKRGRSRAGCDCLGLYIMLCRERLGIEIPDPYCSVKGAISRSEAARNSWLYDEVETPQEGDAILIRARGHPIHVGYCLNANFMLHSEDDNASMVERWSGTKWKNRVVGIYRYAGSSGRKQRL